MGERDGRSTLSLDGTLVEVADGQTILLVAEQNGVYIPTLCHDPRLAPAGACRTCLVEVEGQRRLVPACATSARPKMVVRTTNERVRRHQAALLGLYLTDHPEPTGTDVENEVHLMAERVNAPVDWPHMAHRRAHRDDDRNRWIQFRPDRCILCARCTRYCDEVEGVSAISLTGRGVETTISTMDQVSLVDSSCELCGGCIAVCPTGAMTEKQPLVERAKPEKELTKVRTTCNYCGVGCQMDLNVDSGGNDGRGKVVKVTSPPPGTLPNDGNLCVKGRFAYTFIDHEERLKTPWVRGDDGELRAASWDEALRRASEGLLGVKQRYGADALGFVSSSRCTMEENYLVQKLARAAFGTNNCHQCAAT